MAAGIYKVCEFTEIDVTIQTKEDGAEMMHCPFYIFRGIAQRKERNMVAQETTYTIKDAAKKLEVETHVLRYWEEELGLSIGRNRQGHRFYTKEDMALLENIKKWKEQGMQLKAIRLMLSEDGRLAVPEEVVREVQGLVEKENRQEALSVETILMDERSSKAAKLQFLLENLVSRAVRENNEAVLKELDFQFRQMEEKAQEREEKHWAREEEHYKKLDELLRQRGGRKDKRKRYPRQKF